MSNTSMPAGAPGARRVAVGEVARDPEARLLADDHQLHALGPARDDAVERERRRLRRATTELSNILPSVVQPE